MPRGIVGFECDAVKLAHLRVPLKGKIRVVGARDTRVRVAGKAVQAGCFYWGRPRKRDGSTGRTAASA